MQQWKKGKLHSRSGFESRIRKQLDDLKIEYGYETMKLKYVKQVCPKCNEIIKIGTYTPDLILKQGKLIIEAKGLLDTAARVKMIAVKFCNPDLDIRIIFQRDQRIRKGSKTYYSTWAEKFGFPYSIGETFPKEWL